MRFMNIAERKNFIYRLLSGIFLIFSLSVAVFALFIILNSEGEAKVLPFIALGTVALFTILESILIWKGGKKELALRNIAFNENDRVNTTAFAAVIVGSAIGLGLLILSVVLYLMRPEPEARNAAVIILSITVYLLANCLLYYAYLIVFKKRELDLRKFI